MDETEFAATFTATYIANKEKVWNMVADLTNKKERFEMIQKLIFIEQQLGRMKED